MESLVKKIKAIFIGTFNNIFKIRNKMYYTRLDVCSECEETIFKKKVCGICGCIIKSKITVTDEQCPLGKW